MEVGERIQKYQTALREQPDRAGLFAFSGSLVYGGAAEPREQQIASGMEYYRNEHQQQREVQAAIDRLRAAQTCTVRASPEPGET